MSPSTPPIISNPLRILLLTPPSTPLPPILKAKTNLDPILALRTPYYNATIPIWHDALSTSSTLAFPPTLPLTAPASPSPPSTAERNNASLVEGIKAWQQEWLAPEAREVVRALGAVVVVFRKPASDDGLVTPLPPGSRTHLLGSSPSPPQEDIKTLLSTTVSIITHHTASSYASEPLLLALGMPQPLTPRLEIDEAGWEELGRGCGGWEVLDSEAGEGGKRNEFGEKQGLDRLREALEACEWDALSPSADAAAADEDGFPIDTSEEQDGLDEAIKEAESEGVGLRRSLLLRQEEEDDGDGGDEADDEEGDLQVEELERMMGVLRGVRDMSADLPETQRKKLATDAVRDIMKTL